MESIFDPSRFCRQLGSDLVRMFEEADAATTPGLVGDARETQPRRQLKRLLPLNLGIGTGCVVDSFGGTSMQQDIVVYEQALCPTFSVGEVAAATYFPCEGVVACGEVKSTLGKRELEDSLAKTQSFRDLTRYAESELGPLSVESSVAFRPYGSPDALLGTAGESFDQQNKFTDRIMGFVIAGGLSQSPEQVCERVARAVAEREVAVPEVICVLGTGCVVLVDEDGKVTSDVGTAERAALLQHREPFAYLVERLMRFADIGRTVPRNAFRRYFRTTESEDLRITAQAVVPR